MGIAGATKVKWVGKGLSFKTVQTLNIGNRINVDASALAYDMIEKKAESLLVNFCLYGSTP